MFLARVFGMPRSGVILSSSGASAVFTEARGASAGMGVVRGAVFVVFETDCGGADSGAVVVGAIVVAVGTGTAGADAAAAGEAAVDELAALCPAVDAAYFSSVGHQAWSTEFLSARYCLYISSTSQALAPKSSAESPLPVTFARSVKASPLIVANPRVIPRALAQPSRTLPLAYAFRLRHVTRSREFIRQQNCCLPRNEMGRHTQPIFMGLATVRLIGFL